MEGPHPQLRSTFTHTHTHNRLPTDNDDDVRLDKDANGEVDINEISFVDHDDRQATATYHAT